jgi:hypothetical protein
MIVALSPLSGKLLAWILTPSDLAQSTTGHGLFDSEGAGGGILPDFSIVVFCRSVVWPSGVVIFFSVCMPVSSVQPEKASVKPNIITTAIEALISFRMVVALSIECSAPGNPA